ncbi:MAG: sugar O-acetyltransferase [Firmicutes bacterium]|nr:sugar O-acetyltransferase [Candidatus Colimorpha enterica]
MDKKPIVPKNCFFQGCYNPAYEEEIRKGKEKCFRYNQLCPNDREAQTEILKTLLGKMGKDTIITPPFWCDYGYNITVGDNFYSNHGLIITDGAKVTFGDNVFIAPRCTFTTAEHAIDPEMRKAGVEIAKPITVGNNVWIGTGSVILAGATIGDNTVIGAGSVVKGNIPANVVAVGVPCRVMRPITEADKTRYPVYEPDFQM